MSNTSSPSTQTRSASKSIDIATNNSTNNTNASSNVKNSVLSVQQLDSVQYRNQITMGTDVMAKRKDIHTILTLGLKNEGEEHANPSTAPPPLTVELSPSGLQNLFDTMEMIQTQLDALIDKPAS